MPHSGDYRVEAVGAAGGYDKCSNSAQYRGRGARMIGTFSLSQGEIIHILLVKKEELIKYAMVPGEVVEHL